MSAIILNIDPSLVHVPEGHDHSATSWQISNYPDFEHQYFMGKSKLGDTTNLTTVTMNIDSVVDNRIYYRYNIHYSNGTSSGWTESIRRAADETKPINIQTMIETPAISIKLDYENIMSGEVVFTTEAINFYSGIGLHSSSDWVIEDNNIEPKVSLMNSTSLVELRLPAGDFKDDSLYTANVRHVDTTGHKSGFGSKVFDTRIINGEYFVLSGKQVIVGGKKAFFKVTPKTTQFAGVEVKLTKTDGTLISELGNQLTTAPYIQPDVSYENNPYLLYMRLILKDNTRTEYKLVDSGIIGNNSLINFDPSITYLNALDYIQELSLKGITSQSGYQMDDGRILLAKANDHNIYVYDVVANELVQSGVAYTLPLEDNIVLQYMNFIPMLNGDIVINYASNTSELTDQRSVFKRFTYDAASKQLNEVSSLKIEDEWLATSISASAISTDNDTIYYVPAIEVDASEVSKPLSMYKLDLPADGSAITRTPIVLPFTAYRHVSMVQLTDTKLLVFGGTQDYKIVNGFYAWDRTNQNVYEYDTTTMVFTQVATMPASIPVEIYNFQAYLRRDGNVVLFNSTRTGILQGDQTSYVYNTTSKEFISTSTDVILDYLPYRTSIVLKSGDILRISAKVKDPQRVYSYISNTKTMSSIRNYSLSEIPVNVLTVADGQSIDIEDLQLYDKVVILGTGILRWTNHDIVRTYGSSDFIITRDTTITQAAFSAGNWSSIVKLYGAELTIEN